MKRLVLLSMLALAFVGCRKELEKNTSIASKYAVQNDSEQLLDRFEETIEDINLATDVSARTEMSWMHVAKISAPMSGNQFLSVKDISVVGDFAYIAYADDKVSYASVIDVVDLSNEDMPVLISSLSVKSTDLSYLVADENAVYAIGKSDIGSTQLIKVVLEAGKLSTKIMEETIGLTDITGLVLNEGSLTITSKSSLAGYSTTSLESIQVNEQISSLKSADALGATSTEGTYSILKNRLEKFSATSGKALASFQGTSDFTDVADYKGITITTSVVDGVQFLAPAKTSYNKINTYQIPAVAVGAHTEYVVLGELGGEVSIIQGMEPGEYEKCNRRRRSRNRNNRNRDRSSNVDFGGCQCEDGVKSFTFQWNGNSGERMDFFDRCGNMIVCYPNLQNGTEYTVSGADLRAEKLYDKTYLKYRGCWYAIPTSCSVNMLELELGSLEVLSFVDGENSSCDESIFNEDIPGLPTDCQCEGRMQSFSFVYTGEAGKTIYAWDSKTCDVFQRFENAQPGTVYTVNGWDRHDRLGPKTILATSRYNKEQIHTSCSENILGEEFGPYAIVAYTDGEGSSCEIDNEPVTSQQLMECSVVGADPGYAFYQAVWLDDFFKDLTNGNLLDRGYRFEGGSGVFKELPDGKAVLSGEIYSPNYPDNRFEMTVYFKQKSTWEEWSALGKTFKKGAGYIDGAHENWTYYMMDETRNNVMIGLGDNAGFTSELTQRPSNLMMGFQIGEGGANDKNSAYGMAGWFYYTHPDGSVKHADWNLDVLNCEMK